MQEKHASFSRDFPIASPTSEKYEVRICYSEMPVQPRPPHFRSRNASPGGH